MAEHAGIVASMQRREVRHLTGDTFVIMGDAGSGVGPAEFLGRDDRERARFLFLGGRAAPRTD